MEKRSMKRGEESTPHRSPSRNGHSLHRNPIRAAWDSRQRDTLRETLFTIERALAIQLANAMQPDRERSYRALELLRTTLTNGWRASV